MFRLILVLLSLRIRIERLKTEILPYRTLFGEFESFRTGVLLWKMRIADSFFRVGRYVRRAFRRFAFL